MNLCLKVYIGCCILFPWAKVNRHAVSRVLADPEPVHAHLPHHNNNFMLLIN